ncbi:unnamed protein product [Polarella glacialis]|uniref:Methyltransferase domain-containing protein n=2 Tax=Polarella glacialis TaxID=89957 RepID=A0A813L9X7_POLGL|nr:unnamed protein product [Polarella glacialis]CAE8722512.1 unnamed protein product [Polarella glacialis]
MVGRLPRWGRCLVGGPGGSRVPVPWPDLRLWVSQLPDGSGTTVARERASDADIAFDAYSQPLPGTREVRLGGESFFAFASPRVGAEHLVVWRRVEDVRARAGDYQEAAAARTRGQGSGTVGGVEDPLGASAPLRVTQSWARAQLTAPVWRWDKLDEKDPGRYWADASGDPWMYWESFWAPAEDAAAATTRPAFGDAQGTMLGPLLGLDEGAADGVVVSDASLGGSQAEREARAEMKDKAYSIVYEYNVWGSDVSRSGTGSDLWSPEARLAVTALEAVVDAYGVRSIIDCACGDATWMVPFFVARHPEISYVGVDVVSDVIEKNRLRHPGLQFLSQDLSEIPLPAGADLIFSKETMNHMHLADAEMSLRRFAATGARYLLTNVHEGADNFEGGRKTCYTTYIHYDYELPPFNMRKVASIIEYQGPGTSFTLFDLQAPSA